eukprot:gene43729-54340_t
MPPSTPTSLPAMATNQDIADSNAPIAADLRKEIFRMLGEGKDNQQIIDFMVDRYGDFVRYKPALTSKTALLWFGPAALLLGGLVVMAVISANASTNCWTKKLMIDFWLAAGLLLLVALSFLLIPVLRVRRAQREEDRTALNVALYQERVAELQTQQSEGVLNAAQLDTGRAEAARELLADTLRQRGATVDCITCYRRSGPADGVTPLLAAWRAGRLDALTVSSSEGLRYLVDLLDGEGRAFLQQTPLFVPHARIAENARALGLNKIILTEAADAGLLAGLGAYNWAA